MDPPYEGYDNGEHASQAVLKLYQSWLTIPAQNAEWSMADQRDMVEGLECRDDEAGDVDYLETTQAHSPQCGRFRTTR